MSFETDGAKHIERLKKQRARLESKRIKMLSRKHDCDCEYCDRRGEGAFTVKEKKQLAAWDSKIAEITGMIEKVKDHCKRHGIKLEEA